MIELVQTWWPLAFCVAVVLIAVGALRRKARSQCTDPELATVVPPGQRALEMRDFAERLCEVGVYGSSPCPLSTCRRMLRDGAVAMEAMAELQEGERQPSERSAS